MRMSAHMASPIVPMFQVLGRTMAWLYHNRSQPLMYPRGRMSNGSPISAHYLVGEAEISKNRMTVELALLDAGADADFARCKRTSRLVTSTVHRINKTAVDWICTKQPDTAKCTSGSEIRALENCVEKNIVIRDTMSGLDHPVTGPTDVCEDNRGVILMLASHKLTKHARHDSCKANWLMEHQGRTFRNKSTPTSLQFADLNTKPHRAQEIRRQVKELSGHRHLPQEGTDHHRHLRDGTRQAKNASKKKYYGVAE